MAKTATKRRRRRGRDAHELYDAFGNPVIGERGKPVTAGYHESKRYWWGQHPRDLPFFDYRIIQYFLLDPVVNLGLAMRRGPVANAEFGYLDGDSWAAGVKADKDEVKDFVERQLVEIWTNHIDPLLDAQVYGWKAAEVVYKQREQEDGCTLLELDYLKYLHPEDTRVVIHDEYGLVGMEVVHGADRVGEYGKHAMEGPLRLAIPGKAVWHAFNPSESQWYGESILRKAYTAFADKWFDGGGLDVQRLAMHTDAYAGVRIYYPPGMTYVPGKGQLPNRDIAREIAEQYKSGNVMAIPNAFGKTGQALWRIEDARVGFNPQHLFDYTDKLDTWILRGLEIPDDVLTSMGMTGAWAGKQVPLQAFYNNLQRWANQVLRAVKMQILDYLVEINFGDVDYEVQIVPFWVQAMRQESTGQKMLMEAMQPDMEGGGGLAGLLAGGGGDQATGGFGSEQGQPQMPQGMSLLDRNRYQRLALALRNRGWQNDPQVRRMALEEVQGRLDDEGCLAVGLGEERASSVVERAQNAVLRFGGTGGVKRMHCGPHAYASTQLNLPPGLAHECQQVQFDPGDVLKTETEPHVTVLYGLATDDPQQIMHVCRNQGPVALRLGPLLAFQGVDLDGREADVVWASVESEGVRELHDRIADSCPHEPAQPSYVPHVTLAYVRPGTACKYVGRDDLAGKSCVVDSLTLADRTGNRTLVPLPGMVRFGQSGAHNTVRTVKRPVPDEHIGPQKLAGGGHHRRPQVVDSPVPDKHRGPQAMSDANRPRPQVGAQREALKIYRTLAKHGIEPRAFLAGLKHLLKYKRLGAEKGKAMPSAESLPADARKYASQVYERIKGQDPEYVRSFVAELEN